MPRKKGILSLAFLSLLLSSCQTGKEITSTSMSQPTSIVTDDEINSDVDTTAATIRENKRYIVDENTESASSYVYKLNETKTEIILLGTEQSFVLSSEITIPAYLSVPSINKNLPVTEIADNFLSSNDVVLTVKIPSTVKKLGKFSFVSCQNLKDITVDYRNDSYTSVDGVVYSKDCSEIVLCPKYATAISSNSLTLPFSVKRVSAYAFANCTYLSEIFIPNGVLSIDEYAFYNCSSLKRVYLPNTVTSIKEGAFSLSAIESISLPESLNSLGKVAFKDCHNLKEVTIPSSIQTINYGTFMNCSSLTEIHLSNGLRKIQHNVFSGCVLLKEIFIPKSVSEVEENAFASVGTISEDPVSSVKVSDASLLLEAVTVPSTWNENFNPSNLKVELNYFENEVFDDGKLIYKIIDSSSVSVIGILPDATPAELRDLVIPSTVKNTVINDDDTTTENTYTVSSIIDNCFKDRKDIYTVRLSGDNVAEKYFVIGNHAFDGCRMLNSFVVDSNVKIKKAGVYSFAETSLVEIDLKGDLLEIPSYCFNNCSQLKKVSSSALIISSFAFNNCTLLSFEDVSFADSFSSLEKIEPFAFLNCSSLLSLQLPVTIKEYLEFSFDETNNLASISFKDGDTNQSSSLSTVDGSLYSISQSGKKLIYVPSVKDNALSLPDDLYDISFASLKDNRKISSFSLSQNDKYYVEDGILYEKNDDSLTLLRCPSAKSNKVTVSDKTTRIEDNAFRYSSLETINLSENLISVGVSAFSSSLNLQYVTFKKKTKFIGSKAFENCASLIKIVMPDYVEYLSEGTFENCTSLQYIKLPNSVNKISDNVFNNCVSLNNLDIPSSLIDISATAFSRCEALNNITVSSDNTTYAFQGGALYVKGANESGFVVNKTLAQVLYSTEDSFTLPVTVSEIRDNAFENCKSLQNIYVESGNSYFSSVDNALFKKNSSGEEKELVYVPHGCVNLTIPEKVESISSYAFIHATLLENFNVNANNQFFSSFGDQAKCLYSKDKSRLIKVPALAKGVLTISNDTSTVEEGAFLNTIGGDNGINDIFFSDSLQSISSDEIRHLNLSKVENLNIYAITNLGRILDTTLITSVSVSGTVNTIPESGFAGMTSLSEVNINEGVEKIGNKAFINCNSLPSITIPKSVKEIAHSAFAFCSQLTDVSFSSSSTISKIGDNAFESCDNLVNFDMSNANSLTDLGKAVFKNCTSLQSINFTATKVGYFQEEVFKNCSSLTSVSFTNDNVVHFFDKESFANTAISTFNIPKYTAGHDAFHPDAFKDCNDLVAFADPETNFSYTVVSGILYSCASDTNRTPISLIRFPNSKTGEATILGTSISRDAFKHAGKVSKVIMDHQITIEKEEEFSSCLSLQEVVFGNNINVRDFCTYFDESKIKKVFITSGVSIISHNSFLDATGLEYFGPTASNHESLRQIQTFAFKGCVNLKTFDFEIGNLGNVISYGESAFENCSSLTKMIIPSSIDNRDNTRTVGNNCFTGCSSLTIYSYSRAFNSTSTNKDQWALNVTIIDM